ncbi:MAG: CNNM domain-containing protein [Planctomyces sp.]
MSSTLEYIGWALVATSGIVGSFLCSGSEMGLYSVNRVRLKLAAERGTALSRATGSILQKEIDNPSRVLATCLVFNNVSNNFINLGLTAILQLAGFTELAILVLGAAIIGPVLFVLCDTLPKEVFRAEADRIMYAVAPLLRTGRVLRTGTLALPVIEAAARLCERLVPVGSTPVNQSSRQRIAELLKEGARHGVISESQVSLLDRALALRETTVGDEAVPWHRVRTLGADWPVQRINDVLAAFPYSRFPVTDARGNLVGIVAHLDLVLNPGRTPRELASPAVTISISTSVREALAAMRASSARLAVVIDRSKPVGIVTFKDLVEPLTGELGEW